MLDDRQREISAIYFEIGRIEGMRRGFDTTIIENPPQPQPPRRGRRKGKNVIQFPGRA